MNTKKLLETRARLKSKKPSFLVQDAHKRKELPAKWRKPRGVDAKMRLGKKGHRKKPSQGYRSPKLVRGLHKTGIKLFRVHSSKELENLPRDVGLIISSNVGKKKKLEIIKKAEQMKIKIININVQEFLKEVEKKKEEKIEKKVVKKEKKKEEKVEVKKEEKIEKKEEKELTEKDRKEAEKKEKDKLLTKRVR